MKRTNTAAWSDKKQLWQINVQKDGKRRSFYSSKPGRTGQREANAKADAWLEGQIVRTDIRMEAAYQLFLDSIVSKATKVHVESFGHLYLLPSLGRKKVASLTADDFQTIVDAAAVKGARGKPLSKKSLMNLVNYTKLFMKFCRRKQLTSETLEFLVVPKSAKKGTKRILQPQDILSLFTIDTTVLKGKRVPDKYIHAYRFAVLTGVRPGELAGLEWSDIQGKRVFLQRSLNKDGEITTGKNENARRSFVLTSLAKQELDEQRNWTGNETRIFGIENQSTFRGRWRRYCEYNDIPYVSPYELRHTFVSVAKNLTEGQVKALVGHSYNMDTFGVYGHEVQGEQEETAQKLELIFQQLTSRRTLRRPSQMTKLKSVVKSVV